MLNIQFKSYPSIFKFKYFLPFYEYFYFQNNKSETETVEPIEITVNGDHETSEKATTIKVVEIPIVCESDDTAKAETDTNVVNEAEEDKHDDSIFITSITEQSEPSKEEIKTDHETPDNVDTINFVGDIDHEKETVDINIEKESCDENQIEETNHVENKVVEEKSNLDKNIDEEGYVHIPIVVETNQKDATDSVEVNKDLNIKDSAPDSAVKPAAADEDTNTTIELEDSIISPYLESQKKPETEKKKSFIKQWQEELKEFFSKGDKKDKKDGATDVKHDKKK